LVTSVRGYGPLPITPLSDDEICIGFINAALGLRPDFFFAGFLLAFFFAAIVCSP
jgi:hypothetical protein